MANSLSVKPETTGSTPAPTIDLSRFGWLLPLVAGLILWSYAFPALSNYNVTWDEALGDFFFGQRYASYWTSFDPAFLDFDADPYPEGHRPDLRASPFRTRPWEHYPVGATLGAFSSQVFSRLGGMFDIFDGFHASNILLGSLLIVVFGPFLRRRFGTLAAVSAVVLLFASPRVFAHMMANIKDFPLMVVYTLALVAFLVAYERGSVGGLLAASALWGVSLATKANGLFLPAIPLAMVAIDLVRGNLPAAWHGRRRQLAFAFAGAGLVGPLVMFGLWPYLWADPIGRLGKNLAFVLLRRASTREESMAPVIQAIVLTTPVLILVLAAIGAVAALARARRGDRAAVLLLVWIPAVMARYLVPSAVNYDGVRHFLEIFPALAALAGLGVVFLVEGTMTILGPRLSTIRPAVLGTLLSVLLLLPPVTNLLRTHPFELAYWNRLAGGLAGAYAHGLPQAGDYWGTSYRLGIEWMNENATPGAVLAVPVIEHAVRLVAPARLRRDITIVPLAPPFSPQIDPRRLAALDDLARKRPVYVMFVDRRDWLNPLMVFSLRERSPLVTWDLGEVPVLRIYKHRPPPAQPVPTEPTPTEPVPAEPVPAEPLPAETLP
jgi:hypothetical protein